MALPIFLYTSEEFLKTEAGVELVERLPEMHKACSSITSTTYTKNGGHMCNTSTWKDQKFKVILDYIQSLGTVYSTTWEAVLKRYMLRSIIIENKFYKYWMLHQIILSILFHIPTRVCKSSYCIITFLISSIVRLLDFYPLNRE